MDQLHATHLAPCAKSGPQIPSPFPTYRIQQLLQLLWDLCCVWQRFLNSQNGCCAWHSPARAAAILYMAPTSAPAGLLQQVWTPTACSTCEQHVDRGSQTSWSRYRVWRTSHSQHGVWHSPARAASAYTPGRPHAASILATVWVPDWVEQLSDQVRWRWERGNRGGLQAGSSP